MRSVPTEIREKLLKQFYGGENQPEVRILARQASVNTLLAETIHEDVLAGFGDVAIRQLAGDAAPGMAYAVCVDDEEAHIYARKLPAFAEQEWDMLWSLGPVKYVAIEFDGGWRINAAARCYELVTEPTPYVFFIDSSDDLYVQKWSDTTTRLLLAEGVSHISVCRGWQSTLDTGVDQGLIAGCLRGGKVYYRAYCQQSTGESVWETENEVTELGSGNETLCIFRTNDFRIGFLCENAGEMKYALSARTYAGQAMPPEHATCRMQDARVWFDEAQLITAFLPEHSDAIVAQPYLACYDTSAVALVVTKQERIGQREFLLTFNRPVGGIEGAFADYITLFPVRVVCACTWESNNQLRLLLAQDLAQSVDLTITVSECHEAWQEIGGQKLALEAMEIVISGKPSELLNRETMTVEITTDLSLADKVDRRVYFPEIASVSLTAVVTLPPVGVLPI